MSILALVWWRMGGYGYIWCAMVIYIVALYREVPNHLLLHILLIASVHIVRLNSAKG